MTINCQRLMKDNRLCRAILGINMVELKQIEGGFNSAWLEAKSEKAKGTSCPKGAGQKGKLPSTLEKIIFILFYLKVYPTYDLIGFFFGMNRSQACRWVHKLTPILEKTLGHQCLLPARKIESLEAFYQAFGHNCKDVFVDGTERPVQKKVNKKHSNKNYSGKKKRCTRKMIVACDEKKRICFLGQSKRGRRHDKNLFAKAGIEPNIPKDVTIWGDSGMQGIKHENKQIPKKASKNKPLTQAEKADNGIIAGIRIVVEHSIGGMKRLGCMTDIYRNRKPNFDDALALVSAGLANLRLTA